jgi:hypothetical protein
MAKQQRQSSYPPRLDRVVDHIYAHLNEDIRPEGLTEVACPQRIAASAAGR